MADWTLVPCLIALRSEFNQLAPGRDHASDGSIGDPAHAASVSDHNPAPDGQVHAIDVDSDLRLAGWSMERAVQIVVLRHRGGQDDRLQNVIYNRRIWSRSWGWTARAYTGSNPHDKHAHFSARYTTAQENDTRPWGLLAAQAADEEDNVAIGEDVWKTDIIPNPKQRADSATNKATQAAFALGDVWQLVYNLRDTLVTQSKAIAVLAAQDDTDEDAIIAGVLAGLDAQAIAAAIPRELAQQVVDELAARLQG